MVDDGASSSYYDKMMLITTREEELWSQHLEAVHFQILFFKCRNLDTAKFGRDSDIGYVANNGPFCSQSCVLAVR
jgi:hypothetical protein